ncbi:YtxH domain-containing protein [Clostridium sardiniense]|uniref:YtxH domain-containing protein n=1 Tax=Clostridium sardiniense TaxID=29369 RepID=A0ABS7KWV0_CLOSR|nr:YtxH domain-containing protein [Clostridium sardiniense]MBM7834632.1 gas vesicle protein [Clostridium sardiniense]MBY0755286.1 YtxH domain-containing protein [Clostridium sardiniense]MDQ0459730.1 gas vesicle protein [Clostridium sardiniense]
MGRLIRGMAAGAVIGTAVSMMIMPQIDRRTRRTMRRAGRRMMHAARVDNMMSMIR